MTTNGTLRERIERAANAGKPVVQPDTRPEWIKRGAARDLTWQVRVS